MAKMAAFHSRLQLNPTDALQTVIFVCGLCEDVHFTILVYRMAMR
jgi:hypothetical protein